MWWCNMYLGEGSTTITSLILSIFSLNQNPKKHQSTENVCMLTHIIKLYFTSSFYDSIEGDI